MKYFPLLILLLSSPVHAMGLSCLDPSVIFCMDLMEGSGLTTRDNSQLQLTGTLNGGPAWGNQSKSWKETSVANSTISIPSIPGHYIIFTPTNGEDITTASTQKFDFQGALPFMIGVYFSVNRANPGSSDRGIVTYTTAGTGQKGWTIHLNAQTDICFTIHAVNELRMNQGVLDSNFHSYFVWFQNSRYRFYFDGKLDTEQASPGDFVAPGVPIPLSLGARGAGQAGDFSGNVGRVQIWRGSVSREAADGFAKAFHQQFFNAGEQ